MKTQPHSSWADVYDLAYEQSFGELYRRLTDATIQVIAQRCDPLAKIVDFGAGTGRLSIPLSERGFEVTAVDPCLEMLQELDRKKGEITVRTVESKMEDFTGDGSFDVALCVFTVLLYLLDEDSLHKSLKAAHKSLKPGGLLIIDIPLQMIFQSYSSRGSAIERSVSVVRQAGDIFDYHEDLKVRRQGDEEAKYTDTFQIRYWPPDYVLKVLNDIGFIFGEDLARVFPGTGSSYHLMKKAKQGAEANALPEPSRIYTQLRTDV